MASDAEKLLAEWYRWWFHDMTVPEKLPDALHIRTAVYLVEMHVGEGHAGLNREDDPGDADTVVHRVAGSDVDSGRLVGEGERPEHGDAGEETASGGAEGLQPSHGVELDQPVWWLNMSQPR